YCIVLLDYFLFNISSTNWYDNRSTNCNWWYCHITCFRSGKKSCRVTNYNYRNFIFIICLFWTLYARKFWTSWFNNCPISRFYVFYNCSNFSVLLTSLLYLFILIFTFWGFFSSNRCKKLF